jgi:ADP-ribose pyrophosphatase YjhB (NUDIX family)
MDPEIGRLPVIHYSTSTSDLSGDHLSQESSSSSSSPSKGFSKREILACFIIIIQGLALLVSLQQLARAGVASQFSSYSEAKLHTWMSVNGKPSIYHEKYFLEASKNKDSTTPFFDPPTHYPADAGLVSRVWHSNGSPAINNGLQKGSCWCSGDDYCMCTPSLAIDMILTSGPDHIWMVQRATGGLMALMGGFNEVGETVEEAARREMKEEMNLDLPGKKSASLVCTATPRETNENTLFPSSFLWTFLLMSSQSRAMTRQVYTAYLWMPSTALICSLTTKLCSGITF